MIRPIARTDRLIKQVVGQDVLVYNSSDDTACCLNPLAATVWRLCDGRHAVDQIAALIRSDVELPTDVDAEDVVWGVLDELEAHRLIEPIPEEVGRRELLAKLALLPVFPAILQITAPLMSGAGSPAPTPTPTSTAGVPLPSVSATMIWPTPTPTRPPATSPIFLTPTPTMTPTMTPTITPTMTFIFPTPTPSST